MRACFLPTLILLSLPLFAQEIRLGIYPVKQAGGLTMEQVSIVKTKIERLVGSCGIEAADPLAPLGVQAEVKIDEQRVTEAGDRKLARFDAELIIAVRQSGESGAFLGSMSRRFAAAGSSPELAKSHLLDALPTSDPEWAVFFNRMKKQVVEYFNKNCPQTLAEADRDASAGDFGRALSALVNVPSAAACRADADEKLASTYGRAREAICQKQLAAARASAAVKDYSAAAASLRGVDPEAGCFLDAQNLLAEMQGRASGEFKAELDAVAEHWNAGARGLKEQRRSVVQHFLNSEY